MSAASVGGLQGLLGPAVVGDIDRGAGRHDLVDAVEHFGGQRDFGSGELGLEVFVASSAVR